MAKIPDDHHITYQLQFRKCGKAACSTCRETQGHGPYWYAYWREGSRLCSGYIGKVRPAKAGAQGKAQPEQPATAATTPASQTIQHLPEMEALPAASNG